MHKWKSASNFIVLIIAGLLIFNAPTHAQYTSTNYEISEAFVGAGGVLDAASASYRARASLGDLGVGNSSSTNYQAFGGFTTTDAPYLEVNLSTTSIDLGNLDPSTTATGYAEFYVRAYTADGYNVYIMGDTLTSEGASTIANLTSNSVSVTGVEQFGVNLVANTSPTTIGADPVQVPDATFSFGEIAANYNTANSYRYNSGEVVALSTESSGQTNFTVSYIANITAITEAGTYISEQTFVAAATY